MAATAALALGGLAACGSSGSSTNAASSASGKTSAASAGVTNITVSYAPIAGYALLRLAEDKGLFAKQGLTVKLATVKTVTDSVAAVMGDTQQIGLTTAGTAAVARSQGIDIKLIGPYYYSNNSQGIYVKAGSSIKRPRDLEGKTLGLGQLTNSGEADVLESIAKDGGDPSKVKVTLLSPVTAAAALAAGQIDAAQVSEPQITQAGQTITPLLADMNQATGKDSPNGYAFVSTKWAAQNPGTITKFRAAMDAAATLANSQPDVVRQTIGSMTEIPAADLQKITLPAFGTDMKLQQAQEQLTLMKKYGYITKVPNIKDMVLS